VIGQTLSHYRITAALGAGGMGEVYRATDTRLDREVAIKILPASHAENPEYLARFQREAKTISSLNHPHVCTLHDVGREGDLHYLVMELLEGDSLADRLKKGPLPVHEVLRYGAQIAEALEAAHRHGIVHRDLKPGNVVLTRSGAKLLDFGLARTAAEGATPIEAASSVQTEHRPLTSQGTILGTFQYMAPEQLEGLEADARTDIFALGALLYEMATGQRAFRGDSKTSLIAAIVSSHPQPVSQVVPMTPPALDHVIRTCLAKDPDDRWQNARDVRAELQWVIEGGSQAGAPAVVVSRRRRREQVAWALVAALALTALGLVVLGSRTPPPRDVVRFEVPAPPGTSLPDPFWGSPVVSPDGRRLAFAAREASGKTRLWVRSLDSLEAKPLPDTDRPVTPFWSPDGRSISFISGGLKVVDVSGGAPRVIATPAAFGGAWSRDDVILFDPGADGRAGTLHRVPAGGGAVEPVTFLDESRHEEFHCCPQFLPDGRHFLFMAFASEGEDVRPYIGSLDSPERTPLPAGTLSIASGFLLSAPAPGRSLRAQPFDLRRLETTGRLSPLTSEPLQRFGGVRWGWFSASETGVLAYRAAGAEGASQLVWFDRNGRSLGVVAAPAGAQNVELSPDGRRLLFERRDPETSNRDVWVMELDRGVESRLSFDTSSDEADAVWSPDGSRILWSKQGGTPSFKEVVAAGGETRVLFESSGPDMWTLSWSPDHRYLLYGTWTPNGQTDLMVLALGDAPEPQPFLATPFVETHGQFSPDGRWVAYSSDETERHEVYIRPFPAGVGKWRVSTEGGSNPRWSPKGKELFYLAPDRTLMSVAIRSDAESPHPSAPQPLFQTRIAGPLARDVRNNYAVSPDGERFLIVTNAEESSPPPITVILNWPSLLETR
jgi:Tol biopolymer transport system component